MLYRPTGEKEYTLIKESGYRAFPPRLPGQPIFYPVLNERYAREIASRWNTKDANSQYKGYVLSFEMDDEYLAQFPVRTVGASYHQEFWVPAEKMDEWNRHIIGTISVVVVYDKEKDD